MYSSPAIAGGAVFIGSYDGVFRALDLASGALRWSFDVGGPISGSATVVDGVVYVSRLYGARPGPPHLRPRRGHSAPCGRRSTTAATRPRWAPGAPCTSWEPGPCVRSGARAVRPSGSGSARWRLVLVAAGVLGLGLVRGWFDPGSVEGTTVGFEPAEAPRGQSDAGSWPEFGFDARRTRANPALDLAPPFRRRWTRDAGSLLEFPPVLADGRAIVGTNAGLGLAIDLTTGRELWSVNLHGRVASSPAMAGDLVLFTTKRGGVLALEAATGRQAWRRALGSASESSPLVVAGSAYLGEISGRVVRLDVRTGGVRWSAKAAGPVKASLALSGPNVVVGDYSGRVTAFRRSDGRVVWRTTSPGERLRGPGRFYAGPAVAYGRVYLGNVNGRVVALDEDTGEIAWVRVVGRLRLLERSGVRPGGLRGQLRPPPARAGRGHRRGGVEPRRG